MKPQLLIASPMPGSGKTTFTLGLLRALCRRGLKVQPFKCGADMVDTQYHALAAGHNSVNLDSWMASATHVQYLYNTYGDRADVCLAEGSAGLFDGYSRMKGSSAEVAGILNMPVVLVMNARATGYSTAPILYGLKHFDSAVRVVGVVFNQVASPAHFASLREACTDAGIECLGYLPAAEELRIPSRHLGLTLTARKSINQVIDRTAALVEQHVDLDKLLNLCTRIYPCPYSLPYTSEQTAESLHAAGGKRLRIAVARDPAFCFFYQENLDRLAEVGQITYFSPVYGSDLPEADLVYLPGGYPELFARQLHRRKRLMQQLREYAEKGGKLLAEGGGMLLLARSLTVRSGGTPYEMAGVLPLDFTMENPRLVMGYRSTDYRGMALRGYEAHYSSVVHDAGLASAARLCTARGAEVSTPLYRLANILAGYTHWYWGGVDLLRLWE